MNLKDDNDKKILYNLAKESRIVIENYRPGVREKLNVDPQTLFKINNNLVYLSIKGFRSNSIYNDKPAYDSVIQAMSGLIILYKSVHIFKHLHTYFDFKKIKNYTEVIFILFFKRNKLNI